jgi:glycerophosphoryl diester phosphodiesterase
MNKFENSLTWKLSDPSHPSLKELFQKAPEGMGFNVEIKYPDRLESQICFARERNKLVDSVLDVIFENAGTRPIFISSFDPEVCMLCQKKQTKYSVFFLLESATASKIGGRISYDKRCLNLKKALDFTLAMNFRGIVCRADQLLDEKNTDVIKSLLDSGKIILTYGFENSDAEKVKQQKKIGVHAVITDRYNDIIKFNDEIIIQNKLTLDNGNYKLTTNDNIINLNHNNNSIPIATSQFTTASSRIPTTSTNKTDNDSNNDSLKRSPTLPKHFLFSD